MSSADLRAELECSVCLNIYTDPVMLRCGHDFCRVCIKRVLDTQKGSGDYFCPVCRKRFRSRPVLQRNITLCNIVENFQFVQPDQEESGVFCTHCVDSPVPAVRSCLHCEVSLCNKHLRVHKKSPEHILCAPILSMESRKCSVHKRILEYYCTEDDTCICVTCSLAGEHRGHQVEMLNEAFETKKKTLRNELKKRLEDLKEIFQDEISRAADILLDENTAHNSLLISDDRKTASWSDVYQKRPKTPERFQGYVQVLSSQSFSSGRHYWDVDVGNTKKWMVGMCYPSVERRGLQSLIGWNNKSWGLVSKDDHHLAIHDGKGIRSPGNIISNRVRIYLDYEAGRIAFYELCDPIRYIRTFTTTFTEPLHAGIWVWEGGVIKICGGNQKI
ncbi:putative tripartite motif-containing protein 75 [Rana temporaria]|uniref:putative tripartite motif-containing protein 75 n=1 Tax=Rana temporaria TaxID=8407 RepID=UPI001AACB6E2|nr:putative tripartite motif-containing protein 75 [Rana temporaria]